MHWLSASQITLFRECQRKWAWRHIAHVETPQNDSAKLGQEVEDEQLQPYLRDGRPFDYTRESGYIAASGLATLPQPKTPGMIIQKSFELPSPSWRTHDFAYRGFIDLWLPDSRLLPELSPLVGRDAHVEPVPAIVDFKTTKDLKWRRTEEQLLTDVQAMLYATHALYSPDSSGRRVRAVDLSWMYFTTKKPYRTRTTNVRPNSEHVIKQFLMIDATGREIQELRGRSSDPLDLPPNPDMCESYGGCPHQARCNLSPVQILDAQAALMKRRLQIVADKRQERDMGTAELIAQMRAKQAAAQGQTAATTAPAPAPVVPVAPVAPTTLPAWATAKVDPLKIEVRTGPINPPEAALPPAPPVSAETKKAGPGRPKKATAPVTDNTERDASVNADAGQGVITVTATWGKHTYQPQPYCPTEVGPFTVNGYVLKGETSEQAIKRLYAIVKAQGEAAMAEELAPR